MIADVERWREWKKQHPEFPLTVAPCGQWCKKVRGRTRYFGPLRDPDAAAENWAAEKDYLLAGMTPPALGSGASVSDLYEMFLADVNDRISAGRMAHKTRRDYLPLRALFSEAGVSLWPAGKMGPGQFTAVQKVIERSGRSLRTQKNVLMAIRSMFNWAIAMEHLAGPIRYGPRFVPASFEAIEAEQDGKCRFIPREVIVSALARANAKMNVAIYLGINCAFYPGDSVAITLDHLYLDGPVQYHEFRRVKNGRRRVAVLWPETVEAIREYVEKYRRPVDPGERRLLLTQYGQPYTRQGEARKLGEGFRRILQKVGAHVDGVSLGSLRHTYGTVVDRHPDQSMIDLTMGHVGKGMQKRVYRQLNLEELERLRATAEVVRKWLWPEE